MAENITGDWSTKFNQEKYAKNHSKLKDQSLLLSNQKSVIWCPSYLK